jgi:hypothetical protein
MNMTNQQHVIVKCVLDLWNGRIKEAKSLLDGLTDEQLEKEIAPGKNRGIYLLGHLVAVHDRMIPLLNFGESQYPQLSEPFLFKADKAVAEIPSVRQLREYWTATNSILSKHFNELSADGWFEKHTSVSAEDFEKEPHRNKLNVVMGRTTHLAYHLGQLALLKEKQAAD